MKIFMNTKIKSSLLLLLLLSVGIFAQEGNTKVGTTSANFLQMDIGARAIALGGAYVAVADDATALFWNSAGIALVENGNAVYQFGSRYADIKHHYAGLVYGLGTDDKIGIMINYVDIGDMEITTLSEPDGTGQNFSSSNLAIGLTYARQLTNRVYVGNVRIYKSDDNGNNWNQVFTPENSPFNFSNIGTKALAIEECRFAPNIVMAGFEIMDADKGGLFVSDDYGTNWNQILLEATSNGQDVDVSDIIFIEEGSDTVAYVSALYDLSYPQGRSIYRVVKNGSNWIATQDMDASGTAVGYAITATIWDLELTSTGDTIYATGTDAGINHPITYYKDLSSSNLWTNMTTSGYPFATGKEATAITIGIDTVYVAVDNEIYYYALSGSSWILGYSYPVGTRINFLYFDELLAGTDLGLYAHYGTNITTSIQKDESMPVNFELFQNYPNPFNPATVISYSVPKQAQIDISVYNILGQKVQTLVSQNQSIGKYSVKFDGTNFTSGVYIYQIKADNVLISKKMMLVK